MTNPKSSTKAKVKAQALRKASAKAKAKTAKKGTTKRKTLGKKVTAVLPVPEMGRPPSLTAEKIAAIAQHIAVGNFAVTACALEDVSERTYYHWLELADRDEKAGKASIFVDFLQSIKKASATAENAQVLVALEGGFGWQANMTWLERRFPDRWGQQTKLSLEEARSFVHRLVSVLAEHIPDRELIRKIVDGVKSVKMEKHDRNRIA